MEWIILSAIVGGLCGVGGGLGVSWWYQRRHKGARSLTQQGAEPNGNSTTTGDRELLTQREQLDQLRYDLKQFDMMWRGKVQRIEAMVNQLASGQRGSAGGLPLPLERQPILPLGFLTLEVNGLRKEFPIGTCARMTLGRSPTNDIVVQDMRLSEIHVAFQSDEHRVYVEPLGAAQPVLLNERRLVSSTEFRDGDVITFGGNSRLTLIASRHSDAVKTPRDRFRYEMVR